MKKWSEAKCSKVKIVSNKNLQRWFTTCFKKTTFSCWSGRWTSSWSKNRFIYSGNNETKVENQNLDRIQEIKIPKIKTKTYGGLSLSRSVLMVLNPVSDALTWTSKNVGDFARRSVNLYSSFLFSPLLFLFAIVMLLQPSVGWKRRKDENEVEMKNKEMQSLFFEKW